MAYYYPYYPNLIRESPPSRRRSPSTNSPRVNKKTLPHVAAFVSSALTTASSIPAPSPTTAPQQERKDHLIHRRKNGKPPPSPSPPPLKKKPKPHRTPRSSFSKRGRGRNSTTAHDIVVPFIKPKSRLSVYPRIPSPWVSSRLCQSRPLNRLDGAHERAVFCPRNGQGVGVSLRRCLENKLVEEVARASESIASVLPPAWRRLVAGSLGGYLVINWSSPTTATTTTTTSLRFESPQIEYKFSFVRPDGAWMSVGEFIGQIANIYDFWFRCDFNRLYKNKFSIRADAVRLRELILVDEEEDLWTVEAGY